MSAPQQDAGTKGGPPRLAVAGVVLALTVGLVLAAVWLLGGDRAAPDPGAGSSVVSAPPQLPDEKVTLHVPPADAGDGSSGALPEPAPADVVPLDARAAEAADDGREIRGVTVRASDESAVSLATVIALQRDAGRVVERARARTDGAGHFTLRLPREADTFRVLAPAPGKPRDRASPGKEVTARVEWDGNNPAGDTLRLVLDTGWRCDLYVLDGAGNPRPGVVVTCGARSSTSDAAGRCTLLDLPVGEPSITLGLQAQPGTKRITQVLPAPEAGSLRGGGKITVP